MPSLPKDERIKRVADAAKLLGIEEYLDRKPKALSGGQRQRVAVGRAIVRNPQVFLMDEPLQRCWPKTRNNAAKPKHRRAPLPLWTRYSRSCPNSAGSTTGNWRGRDHMQPDTTQDEPLAKEDLEALARFRFGIRRYLHFSEQTVRGQGLTREQYQLLLASKGFPDRREWRASDSPDGRAVRVELTRYGERALSRLSTLHRDELRRLGAALAVPDWSDSTGGAA